MYPRRRPEKMALLTEIDVEDLVVPSERSGRGVRAEAPVHDAKIRFDGEAGDGSQRAGPEVRLTDH
jgi:hypothetical protein